MYSYVIVDVFTDTPLEGNPLAVFTDGQGIAPERMQQIAREMNLSETVFVQPADGDGDARIRIFTPATELPFAGHPTLGTAFMMAERTGQDMIRLETGVGVIPVEFDRATAATAATDGTDGTDGTDAIGGTGSGEDGRIVSCRMRQPIPTWEPYEHAADLLAMLGVESSLLPVEAYLNGPLHVYVALPSEAAVAALEPDVTALMRLGAVGVNCFAGSGDRWKTRMFGPGLGVPEDPATGSAAGPLALHLARHGRIPFGTEIEIRQGAEIGRPSKLYARVEGAADRIEKVEVAGSAVVVARGELLL